METDLSICEDNVFTSASKMEFWKPKPKLTIHGEGESKLEVEFKDGKWHVDVHGDQTEGFKLFADWVRNYLNQFIEGK